MNDVLTLALPAPRHPAADLEYLFDQDSGILTVQPATPEILNETPATTTGAADDKEPI